MRRVLTMRWLVLGTLSFGLVLLLAGGGWAPCSRPPAMTWHIFLVPNCSGEVPGLHNTPSTEIAVAALLFIAVAVFKSMRRAIGNWGRQGHR